MCFSNFIEQAHFLFVYKGNLVISEKENYLNKDKP